MIPDRPGTAAAGRPAPGQRAFLTDAGLILEPDLNRRRIGLRAPDFLDYPGEVFLNASWVAGLTLTHILLGKLKNIGRDTDQCFRIRVMSQETRYPS